MEYKQFTALLKRRKRTVAIITIVFLIAASLITFSHPLRYAAESRLLVVQNYGSATDAYNVSRSNQFLSNLLAQVVYSDSFYEQVMASGYPLNKNLFSADANERKRQWQDMVYTRAVADTGMIILTTYHQDKNTADLANQAIAYTLMTKGGQYHGLGDNVKIKLIDNSTLSDWPVKPNILLNLLLGLVAGLAAGLYSVYLFPEKALSFKRKKIMAKEVEYSRPEEVAAPVWTLPEIKPEPAVAYEPAESYDQEGEEIEEAGEEDEFEPYFKGDINNLISR